MTQETTKENYPRKNKNLYKPTFYCRFECRFECRFKQNGIK